MATIPKQFSPSDCVMVDAKVLGPHHYVFVSHSERELQKDSYRCSVVEYKEGAWQHLASWPWQAVGVEVTGKGSRRGFHVIGRDGQVGSVSGGAITESAIDPKRPVGPFRGMRLLGDRLFAFGMKREVFLREDSGAWTRFMSGFELPEPTKKLTIAEKMKLRLGNIGGINAIAIDQDGALTAAGMRGEIWIFQSNSWTKIDSPTNVMLKDVVLTSDGDLYACGQAGMLLKGQGTTWEPVVYRGPQKLDLCSACWFKGNLYVADGHSLRTLDDGELKVVDHGVDEIVPCAVVTASSAWVLSVAGQEVWESNNGKTWHCILG